MPTPATRLTTLVSLSTAKAWMAAGGLSGTLDDARIVTQADRASEELERATGRIFVTRTGLVQTTNGDGKTVLKIACRPIVAISSVVVNGATLDPSAYAFDSEKGYLYLLAGCFSCGIQNIVVTYSAGFGAQDAATLPADVVGACLDLLLSRYQEQSLGGTAFTAVSAGNQTVSLKLNPDRLPSVAKVIADWRETRA